PIEWADTIAADWTMFTPTPPTPNTTTDWPTSTAASRFTTPIAVVTAHPKSGATRRSTSSGIGVTRFSDTTARSLNVVTHPALTRVPFHRYVGVSDWRPALGRQCMTTRLPSLTLRTPGPTSM